METWIVRVTKYPTQLIDGPILECFRYAGYISIGTDDEFFDMYCPKSLVSEVWAQQNAARMQTFGYDATAVKIR